MEIISIINLHHVKKDPIPPEVELPEPPTEPDPPVEPPVPPLVPEVPEAYADLTPLHFYALYEVL